MSLAFNVHGEPFELPASATTWRVRKIKPKGAPEVVYGRDGAPLLLGINADVDDLRREAAEPGRYRLDALDDAQRPILEAPPAYVFLHGEAKSPGPAAERDPVVMEALRLLSESTRANTELARTVIERLPSIMESAAVLLRAADGAGMPARPPSVLPEAHDRDHDDDHDDDDDDFVPEAPVAAPSGPDLATVIAQLLPSVLAAFTSRGSAAPSAPATPQPTRSVAPSANVPSSTPTSSAPRDEAAHLRAIQQALTPPEAALVKGMMLELSPEHARAWKAELSALSVGAAVERIRALLNHKAEPEPDAPASDAPVSGAADTNSAPLPPEALAHLLAIQQALTPQEAALTQALASKLAPDDARAWLAELSALSVPAAVERIRSILHGAAPMVDVPAASAKAGAPGGAP